MAEEDCDWDKEGDALEDPVLFFKNDLISFFKALKFRLFHSKCFDDSNSSNGFSEALYELVIHLAGFFVSGAYGFREDGRCDPN